MPSPVTDRPDVQVLPDAATLARVAADLVVRIAQDAIVNRGRASIALSGGTTPQRLYSVLAGPPHTTRLDFSAIDFFFADERCVPPDDPRSNYGLVRRVLLEPVHLPAERVHHIHGELPPAQAADDYDRELRRCFPNADWPGLDLALLGLGTDGHTASLFPGDMTVQQTTAWVAAVEATAPPMVPGEALVPVRNRVTLTLPAINHARHVVFLVDGADKADVVARVLAGDTDLPAARIRPAAGQLRWLVSKSAATNLGGTGQR